MVKYQSKPKTEEISAKEKLMYKWLLEASKCACDLDREGTKRSLSAAMKAAGYSLSEDFERSLDFLMFSYGISFECRSYAIKNGVRSSAVPGWDGAATALRNYMQENGSNLIALYFRMQKLINKFNARLKNNAYKTGEYTKPLTLEEIKAYESQSPNAKHELGLEAKLYS